MWIGRALLKFFLELTLLALAFFLFFYRLDYPAQLIFDETYHIPSAQKYLNGIFFEENHPPLGKMLIALGQKIIYPNEGNTQFIDRDKVESEIGQIKFLGYRFFPALFGVGAVWIFYLICRELIPKGWAYLIGLVGLLDNAFLVQSRAAMLDSFLVFFILFSVWVMLKLFRIPKKIWAWVSLLAVANIGAILIKSSGLIVLVPSLCWWIFGYWHIGRQKWTKLVALWLMVMAVLYVGMWKLHYHIAHKPLNGNYYGVGEPLMGVVDGSKSYGWTINTYLQISEAIAYSKRYNQGVPVLNQCKPDELGSPWYMWPFGGRTINFRWETPDGVNYRYIYLMGNPTVWWLSLIGVTVATAWCVGRLFGGTNVFLSGDIAIFCMVYWSYLGAISQIKRVMYLYHYLPALFIGLILFALVWRDLSVFGLWRMGKRVKMVGLLLLTIVTMGSFWFYRPLTYYLPITNRQFEKRMILSVWDLKYVGAL